VVFYGAPPAVPRYSYKKATSANPVGDSQRTSVWCNSNILRWISFRLSKIPITYLPFALRPLLSDMERQIRQESGNNIACQEGLNRSGH